VATPRGLVRGAGAQHSGQRRSRRRPGAQCPLVRAMAELRRTRAYAQLECPLIRAAGDGTRPPHRVGTPPPGRTRVRGVRRPGGRRSRGPSPRHPAALARDRRTHHAAPNTHPPAKVKNQEGS
jgi:hypothetical protein